MARNWFGRICVVFLKLRNLNLKTGVELRTKLIECSGFARCLLNLSTTIIVSVPPES